MRSYPRRPPAELPDGRADPDVSRDEHLGRPIALQAMHARDPDAFWEAYADVYAQGFATGWAAALETT